MHQKQPPPDVTPHRPEAAAYADILIKAMAQRPPDRWASAEEMWQAMENATPARVQS